VGSVTKYYSYLCLYWFLCLLRWLSARGILFWGCPCVHPCVRAWLYI